MKRALIVILTLFLLVYSHVFIYYWILSSYNFIWRVAFVAIVLVVFYGTIGLASLVAYRNRG